MRPAVLVTAAVVVLAIVAALAIGLSRRGSVAGSGPDEGFPAEWSAGQFTYRTDIASANCELRITTEILEPEGFDAEDRVLVAPLAALDPARIEATPRNPALGLPGLLTFHARSGQEVRCALLTGDPCPTATRDKAELQLPPFWADRPDDFARLIRADIEACTTE